MPDLRDDIIALDIRRAAADLRVLTTGRVKSFARATGRAVVRILERYVTSDGVEREREPSPAAVVWQQAGDGYVVAHDVATDDQGLVIAADAGWDQAWRTGAATRPQSGQRHTLGSAAFLPGGRRNTEAPANAAGTMRIGAADGSASLDLTRTRGGVPGSGTLSVSASLTIAGLTVTVSASQAAAGVKLGSAAASSSVALAPLVKAASAAGWSTFISAIESNDTIPANTATGIVAAASAAAGSEAALTVGSAKVVADL